MALILNIETATRNCSVALSLNGEVIAVREIAAQGYLHAEKLHVFIEECMAEANKEIKDLNAIAISMGPGSYTGLRIGVSAAKGLCYALGIPLIAVDTLEVLARNIEVREGEYLLPMIDARRMEAYTAIFDSNYNKLRETKAEIITEELFTELSGKVHLLGDGAAKCKEVLTDDKFVYHDEALFPSAKQMCSIAYNKYKISDTVDVAYFEPFYLKDFIVNK